MKISTRSVLMAGVTTLTASAVAIAPSVQPPPPPKPAIQLVASNQVLQQQLLVLQPQFDPVAFLIGLPPSLGAPFPTPTPPSPVPAPGSIGSSIKDIYNSIEFWVDYGFEVGAWAFGWVPWIGWLAPQIWPIGYTLGETIVRSIVFNIADWLDGNVSFLEGLINVGEDSIRALINFGIAEWNFFLPSLPIPPLPGIFTASAQPMTLTGLTEMPGVGVENAGTLRGLLDRVFNPLNAGGKVDGVTSGASLSSLFRNGIAEFGDILGGVLSPPDQEKMSEISTVPSLVKTPFTPLKSLLPQVDPAGAGPLTEVTKTVRDVRKEVRASFNERRADKLAGDNVVVRAQGDVRGRIANAASDIVNAVRGSKSDSDADGAKTPSTTVVNSVRDTVKKVVKDVRDAANDARESAKDRTSDDE